MSPLGRLGLLAALGVVAALAGYVLGRLRRSHGAPTQERDWQADDWRRQDP